MLDLGKVGVTASVQLNGKLLNTIWYAKRKFEVSAFIKEDNTLQVTVGKKYRNRITGDFVEFGKLNNVWATSTVQEY